MKHNLIHLFLIIVCNNIHAQNINTFQLGLEAGPNVTRFFGNPYIKEMKPDFSATAGVFILYKASHLISLKTSILFERKSYEYPFLLTDIYGNNAGKAALYSSFDYLTIPVLLRMKISSSSPFFINAGPYLGFLVNQTELIRGGHLNYRSYNINNYKPFEMGASFGFGYSFKPCNKFTIGAELRSNIGLNTISKGGVIKTNTTCFLISLAYPLQSTKDSTNPAMVNKQEKHN